MRVVTAGVRLFFPIVALVKRVSLLAGLLLLPAVTSADSPNWFAGFELLKGHAAPGRGDRSALFDLGVEQRLSAPISVGTRFGIDVNGSHAGAVLNAALFTRVEPLRVGSFSLFVEGDVGALSRAITGCDPSYLPTAAGIYTRLDCGTRYRTGLATGYGIGTRLPLRHGTMLTINLLRLSSDDGTDYVMAGVSWM